MTTTNPEGDRSPRIRAWQAVLITFVSSACIMTLELVAGRIIAPQVGVSLYTWTSVIGVILAGISLGNYIGGRLADRRASARLLGLAFLLGGLLSFGALAVDPLGGWISDSLPIIVQILLLTAGLFLAPAVILGTISPILVKLSVRDVSETGSVVGRIYAAGSLGSIVGTFATGFYLISQFGTRAIVWGVGVILVALGTTFLARGRWPWLLLAGATIIGASGFVHNEGLLQSDCTMETNYFCIKVRDRVINDKPVRSLVLDRMVHSYSALDDPTWLIYDYEEMSAELLEYRAESGTPLRTLFVGGGGYTLPRYVEAIYPGSDVHVIEIDPGVSQVARDMLGVEPDAEIVSFNEDARLYLAREPSQRYDLVFGDAFNDFSVPYHLTTREFNESVRNWLEADGLYVINMIDGPGERFLRAMVHTLKQTFDHVYVAPAPLYVAQEDAPRNTYVVVASDTALDRERVRDLGSGGGAGLFCRQLLDENGADALMAKGPLVTLTDDYAPVDQMLMAVFRDEVPDKR